MLNLLNLFVNKICNVVHPAGPSTVWYHLCITTERGQKINFNARERCFGAQKRFSVVPKANIEKKNNWILKKDCLDVKKLETILIYHILFWSNNGRSLIRHLTTTRKRMHYWNVLIKISAFNNLTVYVSDLHRFVSFPINQIN